MVKGDEFVYKLEAKTDGKSMDVVSDNIMQLNNLFPEVFTEGKINFEILKQLLGEYTDDREERYSFNWNGKSQARMIAQTPSTAHYVPVLLSPLIGIVLRIFLLKEITLRFLSFSRSPTTKR
jgi:hypothetical protein